MCERVGSSHRLMALNCIDCQATIIDPWSFGLQHGPNRCLEGHLACKSQGARGFRLPAQPPQYLGHAEVTRIRHCFVTLTSNDITTTSKRRQGDEKLRSFPPSKALLTAGNAHSGRMQRPPMLLECAFPAVVPCWEG